MLINFNFVVRTVAIFFLFTSCVFAQTHQPSVTVDGRTVTFDADTMWWDHAQDMTGFIMIQGTPIHGPRYAVSSDGISSIGWTVPPGSYTVTAHGFPDDPMFPNRVVKTLTVIVEAETRQEQINDAVYRFYFHRDNWQAAKKDMKDLQPTDAELETAIQAIQ